MFALVAPPQIVIYTEQTMLPYLDFVLVVVAAATASALTLFSGFGLGTLLLPVFALFLPVELAVAATAIVHGANNVLKVALLGRDADRGLVLRFGLPAVVAAFVGAYLLKRLSGMTAVFSYSIGDHLAVITPLELAMALLMVLFAVLELHPRFANWKFDQRHLVVGGLLSGFFGGLSGHQGALRSAFLAKAGVTPAAFVGTSAVIGLVVDLVRLLVYGALLFGGAMLFDNRDGGLVVAGVGAAFAGVLVGKRLLPKVTIRGVQTVTALFLLMVALLLGLGLL